MSSQPYKEISISARTGVDTSGPNYSNPDGGNRPPPPWNSTLRTGYPSRGSVNNTDNRPLETNYKNKAFGNGRNENPYKNNYKRGFDPSYPSIWRRPTTVNFVRRLDDWERSALSAALGVPWIPSSTASASSSSPALAPSPGAEVSETLIYGPITINLVSSSQSGGAMFNTGENFELYVSVNGTTNNYFVKNRNNELIRLNQNGDILQIIDPESGELLQSSETVSSIITNISSGNVPQLNNQPDISNTIINTLSSNISDTTFKLNVSNDSIYNILYDNTTQEYFIIKGSEEYVLAQKNDNESQAIFGESIDNSYVGNITDSQGDSYTYTNIPSSELQQYNLYVKKNTRYSAPIQTQNPEGDQNPEVNEPLGQPVTIHDTQYMLSNDGDPPEVLNIKYCSSPEALFYITDNNGNEYEIGPLNDNTNSEQAYYNINGEPQVFNIKNGDNNVSYEDLVNSNPASNNPTQSYETHIIRLDGSSIPLSGTTGGKYKKNKNKSRRLKKHFRKTRKSRKE